MRFLLLIGRPGSPVECFETTSSCNPESICRNFLFAGFLALLFEPLYFGCSNAISEYGWGHHVEGVCDKNGTVPEGFAKNQQASFPFSDQDQHGTHIGPGTAGSSLTTVMGDFVPEWDTEKGVRVVQMGNFPRCVVNRLLAPMQIGRYPNVGRQRT